MLRYTLIVVVTLLPVYIYAQSGNIHVIGEIHAAGKGVNLTGELRSRLTGSSTPVDGGYVFALSGDGKRVLGYAMSVYVPSYRYYGRWTIWDLPKDTDIILFAFHPKTKCCEWALKKIHIGNENKDIGILELEYYEHSQGPVEAPGIWGLLSILNWVSGEYAVTKIEQKLRTLADSLYYNYVLGDSTQANNDKSYGVSNLRKLTLVLTLVPSEGFADSYALAIGDVDNDGKNELIVGNAQKKRLEIYTVIGNNLNLIATKTFSEMPKSVIVADPDNDNLNEIVVGTSNDDDGGYVYVLNYNNGQFTQEWKSPPIYSFRFGKELGVGDLNNNGENEIVVGVSWYGRTLLSYEYNGSGYEKIFEDPIGSDVDNIEMDDIDNDDIPELLVGTGCWRDYSLRIYKNYNLIAFERQLGITDVSTLDIDNDGNKEIIVGVGTICSNPTLKPILIKTYKYYDESLNLQCKNDFSTSRNSHVSGTMIRLDSGTIGTSTKGVVVGTTRADDNYIRLFTRNCQEVWNYKLNNNEDVQAIRIGDVNNDGRGEIVVLTNERLLIFAGNPY